MGHCWPRYRPDADDSGSLRGISLVCSARSTAEESVARAHLNTVATKRCDWLDCELLVKWQTLSLSRTAKVKSHRERVVVVPAHGNHNKRTQCSSDTKRLTIRRLRNSTSSREDESCARTQREKWHAWPRLAAQTDTRCHTAAHAIVASTTRGSIHHTLGHHLVPNRGDNMAHR